MSGHFSCSLCSSGKTLPGALPVPSDPFPLGMQQVSPVHVPRERERTCRCQRSRLGGRRHLPQRSTPACLQRPQQSFIAAARYYHPSEHVGAPSMTLKVCKLSFKQSELCNV